MFAKRAKSGYFKHRRKGRKGKRGTMCFTSVKRTANYLRKHGYKVIKK